MSTNIEVLSAVHGIAPRSNELHRLGSAAEKGRASWEDYAALRDQETTNWLAVQADAGIDIQENGKLAWADHLRPLVKASEGFAPDVDDASVTRWFDTNRFYRQPTIVQQPRFSIERFTALYGQPSEHVSLLAPASFAGLCVIGETVDIGEYYTGVVEGLIESGVDRITFESYADSDAQDIVAIDELCEGLSDATVALLSHAGTTRWIPDRFGFAGIGLTSDQVKEFASQTPYVPLFGGEPLRQPPGQPFTLEPIDFTGKELWLTPITAEQTLRAVPEIASVLQAAQALRPARIVLTHTTDLEQVPLPYAESKLHQLGELAEEAKRQLEKRL